MNEFPIIEKLGGRESVLELIRKMEKPRKNSETKRPHSRFSNWKDPERGMPLRVKLYLEMVARDRGIATEPDDFEIPDASNGKATA